MDRFPAFRFKEACANNMLPDYYVAIRETLYPTRDGILFKTCKKISQQNMVETLQFSECQEDPMFTKPLSLQENLLRWQKLKYKIPFH